MNKSLFLAVSLLAGTIIGAGIFSLPYVFSRLGLALSFLYLLVFTGVYFFVHLMYGDLVEKHKGQHEFFYLAHRYLPARAANFVAYLVLAELVFVLVAYLALVPSFFSLITNLDSIFIVFGFWFLGSLFMFLPLKWLGRMEFLGILGIIVIIIMIFVFGKGSADMTVFRSLKDIDWKFYIIPFGPLLFALSGRPAISRLVDLKKTDKDERGSFSFKKAIFWGTFIPALVYLFFVIAVLKLGLTPAPDTISGVSMLPYPVLAVLGFLGFLTLWTSYFIMGINIREIVREDIQWPRWAGAALAVLAPLIIYFLGAKSFFKVISFTGGMLLGLEAIVIVYMWRRAFRGSDFRFLSPLLYLIFVTAIIWEVYNFFASIV